MIREERVARLRFDASSDELTLECEGELGGKGPSQAQILLDRAGFLVGVDLGSEPNRIVAMLGRHEDVDHTESARVVIEGSTVRVQNAKKSARAHERNPYVK